MDPDTETWIHGMHWQFSIHLKIGTQMAVIEAVHVSAIGREIYMGKSLHSLGVDFVIIKRAHLVGSVNAQKYLMKLRATLHWHVSGIWRRISPDVVSPEDGYEIDGLMWTHWWQLQIGCQSSFLQNCKPICHSFNLN